MNLTIDLAPDEQRQVENPKQELMDLRREGISRKQAAKIRAGFETFAEDWDVPEMDIYDRYDSVVRNR